MSNQERDSYNPSAVEGKWQRNWEERGTNSLTLEQLKSAKDPYYQLMMFPYPSAEGLHVGNIYAFTGADVHGRFLAYAGSDRLRTDGLRCLRNSLRELRFEDRYTPDGLDTSKC